MPNQANTGDISRLSLRLQEKLAVTRGRLDDHIQAGRKCFATSSFQTQSVPLLHILSTFAPQIPVVFIDTGYLFPETLEFRDKLSTLLSLELIHLRPERPKSEQITRDGRLLFAADPDRCCHYNKVEPLAPLLRHYDLWISGIRRDQSHTRQTAAEESRDMSGIQRYHPMLNWSASEIDTYIDAFSLPRHPLDSLGYTSIGCIPCTAPARFHGPGREGRWYGARKTECGLHAETESSEGRSR